MGSAHRAACEAGYMHRDISAGNILIYPSVIYLKDAKVMAVRWCGVLSDWELAKDASLMVATQPERTVRDSLRFITAI